MNKKKVLALMAMLTVTAMVTACGGKKDEAAVTETQAVESTVVESTVEESTAAETAVSENTEPLIEDNSDVALADSVEETEEEMSVVEYNAECLSTEIYYSKQSMDVAMALDNLGFGQFIDLVDYGNTYISIIDDKGMVVRLHYNDSHVYIDRIETEDAKTVLWEWEYVNKSEDEIQQKLSEYMEKE